MSLTYLVDTMDAESVGEALIQSSGEDGLSSDDKETTEITNSESEGEGANESDSEGGEGQTSGEGTKDELPNKKGGVFVRLKCRRAEESNQKHSEKVHINCK